MKGNICIMIYSDEYVIQAYGLHGSEARDYVVTKKNKLLKCISAEVDKISAELSAEKLKCEKNVE